MPEFTIGDHDFLLDGEPVRVLAGALHYFRVHPDQWRDRIRKAKAMGLNTIETYVAWNAHARREGEFDLSGGLDLGRFLDEIAEEGMHAIVRPGPYICAEWDNGGLPAWLFAHEGVGVRRDEPKYLAAVQTFLEQIAPVIVPRQVDRGGPIILVQIENEYGAYGSDKVYLEKLVAMNRGIGLTVPFTTVDQPTDQMLDDGSLPSLLKTGSFGSRATERLATLRAHQPTGPLMCSEFWDGWFDFWGAHHHTTSVEQSAGDLDDLLAAGASVNIYMFHGGTNFGFTNGANDKGVYQPTVTSYDYDAPLDEAGNPTPKYWAFQRVLAKYAAPARELVGVGAGGGAASAGAAGAGDAGSGGAGGVAQAAPDAYAEVAGMADGAGGSAALPATSDASTELAGAPASAGSPAGAQAAGVGAEPTAPPAAPSFTVPFESVLALAEVRALLGEWSAHDGLPTMDEIGRFDGFALYCAEIDVQGEGVIEFGEIRDRAIVTLDGVPLGVLARDHHDVRLALPRDARGALQLLVEDQGRVNYGPRIGEPKGLIGPARLNGEPLLRWQAQGLTLDDLAPLTAALSAAVPAVEPVAGISGPAFALARFDLPTATDAPGASGELPDLYLDTTAWGKGVAWVNGFNLGRYWSRGPQATLYVPGSVLRPEANDLVIFELHAASPTARFAPHHNLGHTDF